jgi:hypothetical protein
MNEMKIPQAVLGTFERDHRMAGGKLELAVNGPHGPLGRPVCPVQKKALGKKLLILKGGVVV